MLAVFVNCFAVIIGSAVGLIFAKRISSKLTDIIQDAAGIITLVLGIQMALQFKNVIYLSLSLFIGGIIGNAFDLDGKIQGIGNRLEKLLLKARSKKAPEAASENGETINSKKDFGFAFLNASCLFCVGAMAIIGSFEAGISRNYTTIFTKSILDGFMAITFSASMGIGTLFSFVAIFFYQGALTLLSTLLSPFVTDAMLSEITGVGGAMIVMIAINLLGLKKIKTANFLPAIVFVVIFVLCESLFGQVKDFISGLF